VHDLVTDVHTGATANTHVLQAITNINTGRTDLNTEAAVHTVAHTGFFVVNLARSTTAGFTTHKVVGHHKGIAVHHGTLEACVGAHVPTDGFTHETGVTPGGKGVEQEPDPLPRAQRQGDQLATQFTDRSEVADKGTAGPQ